MVLLVFVLARPKNLPLRTLQLLLAELLLTPMCSPLMWCTLHFEHFGYCFIKP